MVKLFQKITPYLIIGLLHSSLYSLPQNPECNSGVDYTNFPSFIYFREFTDNDGGYSFNSDIVSRTKTYYVDGMDMGFVFRPYVKHAREYLKSLPLSEKYYRIYSILQSSEFVFLAVGIVATITTIAVKSSKNSKLPKSPHTTPAIIPGFAVAGISATFVIPFHFGKMPSLRKSMKKYNKFIHLCK